MNSLRHLRAGYMNLENNIFQILKQLTNPGSNVPVCNLVPLDSRLPSIPIEKCPQSLLEESIMWAVPKKKRSRERVMTRKFGHPKGVFKLLPIKKLLTCLHCGGPQEIGFLCPTCFKKRMSATKDVQEAVNDKFGLSPIDKEFIPFYEGETIPDLPSHIPVEIQKRRPSFFCSNLKTPSTPANPDSTTIDVVPDVKVLN